MLVLPWWLSACAGGGDAPVKAAVAETPVKVAAEPVAVPAPRKAPAITDCPAVLDRPESGDRLIAGSCGPVTVRKGYRVESGTLTLEAGVQLAFEPGAELTVGYQQAGQLIVRGTAERPVLMTAAGAKVKGSWRGVYLYEHADGSEITGLHIEYGGEGIRGPIYVLAEDVRIDHSTIRDCLDVPVHVSQKGRLASFSGNTVLRPTSSVVMFVPPSSVPAIADDNKFPEGSAIHVLTGIVRERVRWNNPGVPYSIGGLIEIAGEDEDAEALVELSPGTVLKFDEDAYINVGYYRPGTLRAEGSAAQPIVFTALGEAKPGAWRGVNLYKNASASFSHVHFEYGSRRAEWGVLFANSRAALAVSDCTFRHNGGGVVLQGGDLRISEFARNKFEDSTPALDLSAQAYGALGEGLELDEAARVIVEGGRVTRTAFWRDLGVPIEVTGPVDVEGATLTIAAGVDLRVRDGFTLAVGQVDGGSLKVLGTAAAPVKISGVNDRRGTWDAIRLYGRSRGNSLAHLLLRNAGGDAAVDVEGEAELETEGLACARCFAPTLAWSCGARVKQSAVSFSDGTPAGVVAPTGCGT